VSVAYEIERLDALRKSGALSEEEYQQAKTAVLEEQSAGPMRDTVEEMELTDANTWSMWIHLSQYCAYAVPIAGIIVPIVLWQLKKDESEIIDLHGKIVVNWLITSFIMLTACIVLYFVFIGIPLLIALGIAIVVFPVVGGLKANDGEAWPYPLSINFLPLDHSETD